MINHVIVFFKKEKLLSNLKSECRFQKVADINAFYAGLLLIRFYKFYLKKYVFTPRDFCTLPIAILKVTHFYNKKTLYYENGGIFNLLLVLVKHWSKMYKNCKFGKMHYQLIVNINEILHLI